MTLVFLALILLTGKCFKSSRESMNKVSTLFRVSVNPYFFRMTDMEIVGRGVASKRLRGDTVSQDSA